MTSRLEAETAEQSRVAADLLARQLPQLDEWRAALRSDEIDGVVVVARGARTTRPATRSTSGRCAPVIR